MKIKTGKINMCHKTQRFSKSMRQGWWEGPKHTKIPSVKGEQVTISSREEKWLVTYRASLVNGEILNKKRWHFPL